MAKPEDKESVLKMVGILYGKEFPQSVKMWEKDYPRIMKQTIIIEDKKDVIAYASFMYRRDSLYVGDIYVKPKYRRKNLGIKLLKSAEKIQKKKRKKYLKIDAEKKNKAAQKLYKKFGFKFWKPKSKDSLKLRK